MYYMIMLGLLFVELVALYFLSRWVTKSLFTLFLLIFRNRSVAISLMLLLQFPGTVIHELAHLFTAEILRVPTGKITLVPENIRDQTIKSGSVTIAQTDPFRRYAIGLAPQSAGVLALTAIAYLLPTLASQGPALRSWEVWLAGYLIFSISNTMFSSPEDLRGFWPFALVAGAFVAAAYVYGLRLEFTGQLLEVATRILTTLTQSLGIVIFINILLFAGSWILKTALSRLLGIRIG